MTSRPAPRSDKPGKRHSLAPHPPPWQGPLGATATGVPARRASSLEIRPERALLLFSFRLGEVLVESGEARRAEAVLAEALDLGVGEAADRARVVAGLGAALAEQGRAEPALHHLKEAVRLCPRQAISIVED